MEAPASGRFRIIRPAPVYIGNVLVPGTGPSASASAGVASLLPAAQQDEKRSGATMSQIHINSNCWQSSYGHSASGSGIDPQHLSLGPSNAFKSNAVVIVDLGDEGSDQELVGSSTAKYRGVYTEPEVKVKLERPNETEQTQRGEERQRHRQHTPRRQLLHGNNLGTLPTPASIKFEEEIIVVQPHQKPHKTETIVTLSPKLPQHLLDQVDEWYDRSPEKIPPFATSCNLSQSLYRTAAGAAMTYWHKSGEPLEVTRFDLPEQLYPAPLTRKGNRRLMVAKGRSIEPFIFRFSSSCKDPLFNSTASAYKAWVGLDRINKDGFEFEPSVFKVPALMKKQAKNAPSAHGPTEKTYQNHSRSLRTNVNQPKPYAGQLYWPGMKRSQSQMEDPNVIDDEGREDLSQLSITHPEKSLSVQRPINISPRLPENLTAATSTKRMKHTDHSQREKNRREADQDVFDAITVALDPERSQPQNTKQQAARRARVSDSDQLDLHMRNNTVLLFFPNKAGIASDSPRPRMLGTCDSVSRLFAQALAGSVFPGPHGQGGTRVLSLRIDNQHHVLPMVEDDEQDFETFLAALKQAKCWSNDFFGQVRGCCTVEVRLRAKA